ncbi:unnamed protein product [Parajaminaea phylloscopi]
MVDYSSIYDPLNRIDLPPPRHAVESDSESDFDDDDDDDIPRNADALSSSYRSHVSLETVGDGTGIQHALGKPTLFLVGQAGEGLATHLAVCAEERARLMWHDRQQASVACTTPGNVADAVVVVVLYPSTTLQRQPLQLVALVDQLMSELKPTSVTMVTQYHPSLYIDRSEGAAMETDIAPIRWFASEAAEVPETVAMAFASPNYLTGLEATVIQSANYRKLPAMALLLPKVSPARPIQQHLVTPTARRSSKNRRANPLADGEAAGIRRDDFDDDDGQDGLDVLAFAEEPDPAPLHLEDAAAIISNLKAAVSGWTHGRALSTAFKLDAGVLADGTTLRPAASTVAFVASRRQQNSKRRRETNGMYV